MSPHNVRVLTHNSGHKCVGKKAICVLIGVFTLTANGPLLDPHQGEGPLEMDLQVNDTTRPSSTKSLVKAFNLHINALLESTPPSPLKEKLTHFMEHDWHDIEKLLEGGKIDSVEDIKSHWRQIELLVGDTNDIFLQEGALLLSLVLGETDLASEFYVNVKGMEMCILEGMRDESLPDEVRSLLPKCKTKLFQCRNEVQKVAESGMQRDKRPEALVTQRKNLFAEFEAFLDQTPQSRYRDLFKRQGYKCLMSLQNCQRSPLRAPELAAFSRSLRAVAANTSDSNLFGKLFHVIYTTLRDANESPTTQIASLLAAQCNEILSQHEHLLSPLVVKILKAQGETAHKCVTESVAERAVSISDGWLSHLVDSVSNLVYKWWGADVDEKGLPARQGPVTASEIIASVNPALAGTIDHFLKSIQAVLIDVPLGPQQLAALQRLLQTEVHIVDQLKKACEGATKSEMETYIKQEFISHVNSLWPLITNNLESKVSKALSKKYTETFKIITQSSTLSSLIQRVTKLTCDRRVQVMTSFVIMLNSLVSGVEGAPRPDTADESSYALYLMGQKKWQTLVCPALKIGPNSLKYWHVNMDSFNQELKELFGIYTCTQGENQSAVTRMLQVWRDMFNPSSLCKSQNYTQETGLLNLDEHGKVFGMGWIFPAPLHQYKLEISSALNLDCVESFLKQLKDFRYEAIIQHCRRGMTKGSPKQWVVPVSNHPSGPFTYCVDSKVQILPSYPTLDEAQFEQLQCRRYDKTPLPYDRIPPSLVMKNATVDYIKDEGGVLVFDTESQKWMTPCPKNLPPLEEAAMVSKAPKQFTKTEPVNGREYILGPPLPHLASGKQSTINVDGVVYGLYKETPSGLKPIMNKAFDTTTPTPTLPSTQSHEQSVTQPSSLSFSFPVYPSLVVSNSTAVGPITTEGAVLSQHLWEALPWIGGVAAAAAVALCVYQQCRRPHIPTHTLIQQHTSGGGGDVPEYISQPLAGMRVNGAVLSRQDMSPQQMRH